MTTRSIGMQLAAAASVCLNVALAAGAEPQPPLGPGRYLLLDSRVVEKSQHVRLTVGVVKKHPANPLFGQDKPWEPRFDNLYANVLYDRQDKIYKCWYSPFIVDNASSATPRKGRYRPRRREMGAGCSLVTCYRTCSTIF